VPDMFQTVGFIIRGFARFLLVFLRDVTRISLKS